MLNSIEKFKVAIVHLNRDWNHCSIAQGQCGHKWEGDDEPGHSIIDNETLS